MTILPLRDKNTNRLFWHSEIFSRVDYEIRENHLVIFGYSNGQMSISLDRLGGVYRRAAGS